MPRILPVLTVMAQSAEAWSSASVVMGQLNPLGVRDAPYHVADIVRHQKRAAGTECNGDGMRPDPRF